MKYKNVLYTKDRHSFPNSKSFQVKGERHYNACKTTHETGILTSIYQWSGLPQLLRKYKW